MTWGSVFCVAVFSFTGLLCRDIPESPQLPRARNVTWSSINFKTILTWAPNPTNHSYTVEFAALGSDVRRTPSCIRSQIMECDLTKALANLKETYYADVLSEPPPGESSDLVEFPHTRSQRFCPYTDTLIGRPKFTLQVNEEKTRVTLHIDDPISAVYRGDKLLTMRDIFGDDLKYQIIYRKASSTGRRTMVTPVNQAEVAIDNGESYCFSVQAFIPSRRGDRQLGELSRPRCSPANRKSVLEEYSLVVIASAVGLGLVILVVLISLVVYCCRRCCRRGAKGNEPPAPA